MRKYGIGVMKLLVCSVLMMGIGASRAGATDFQAGVGTAYLTDGTAPEGVIEAAFADAWKDFGQGTARLVLILENMTPYNRANELLPVVIEEARGLPVYGGHMGSGNYTPQSLEKDFQASKGMTVLVLGGDFDFEWHLVEMEAVRYAKNSDKTENPEKYAADVQTMVDNRQKPGAELAGMFTWGPDENILFVVGQLHNPEIRYLADGIREVLPKKIQVIGGASQGGFVYNGNEITKSAVMGLRISGKLKVSQAMRGPCWGKGEKVDETRTGNVKEIFDTLKADVERPDAVLGFMCASWEETALDRLHDAVLAEIPEDVPYFASFSGGEMGIGDKGLTGGGAFCVLMAISGRE